MKIDNVLLPTFAGISVMMSIYANHAYDQIKRYQTEILQYELQITNFKLEADTQQKRLKEAKEEADKELADAKETVNHILAEKVPKDCKQAIAWGIQQAKAFR